MKKTKKLLAVILSVAMVFAIIPITATAAETQKSEAEICADMLSAFGMFKGTESGYELERTPNRIEASVMLVRLLGKESVALASTDPHPFTDVPAWASGYVSYMYAQGLTKGVSETSFDPNSSCDGKMFATFALRSLGFDDSKGDFTYDQALTFGRMQELLTGDDVLRYASEGFKRGDMAMMSFDALFVNVKGSDQILLQKLYDDGAAANANTKKMLDIHNATYLVAEADYNTFGSPYIDSTTEERVSVSAQGYAAQTISLDCVMKAQDVYTNPKVSYLYSYSFPDGSHGTFSHYIIDGYEYIEDLDGNLTKEKYNPDTDTDDSASGLQENLLEKYQAVKIDKASDGAVKITVTFSPTSSAAVYEANLLAESYIVSEGLEESQYMALCSKYEMEYSINTEGQLISEKETVELSYMEDGDKNTYKMSGTITTKYNNIGKAVTVTVPTDLSKYKPV